MVGKEALHFCPGMEFVDGDESEISNAPLMEVHVPVRIDTSLGTITPGPLSRRDCEWVVGGISCNRPFADQEVPLNEQRSNSRAHCRYHLLRSGLPWGRGGQEVDSIPGDQIIKEPIIYPEPNSIFIETIESKDKETYITGRIGEQCFVMYWQGNKEEARKYATYLEDKFGIETIPGFAIRASFHEKYEWEVNLGKTGLWVTFEDFEQHLTHLPRVEMPTNNDL